MKIVIDDNMKVLKLVKKDGTVISTYKPKVIEKEGFTYNDFKTDIQNFNAYLEKQNDFDSIKDLLKYVNSYDF